MLNKLLANDWSLYCLKKWVCTVSQITLEQVRSTLAIGVHEPTVFTGNVHVAPIRKWSVFFLIKSTNLLISTERLIFVKKSRLGLHTKQTALKKSNWIYFALKIQYVH